MARYYGLDKPFGRDTHATGCVDCANADCGCRERDVESSHFAYDGTKEESTKIQIIRSLADQRDGVELLIIVCIERQG